MKKAEACKFLGVSERSLARYASQGKVGVTYVKGERGNVAVYDDDDLERLKQELSQPVNVRPAVERMPATSDNHAMQVASSVNVPDLFALIAERLRPAEHTPLTDLAVKLTLSLAEAAALSGLSRSFLADAIHQRKLKAAKRGRGWNIKRADLDSFIKKL